MVRRLLAISVGLFFLLFLASGCGQLFDEQSPASSTSPVPISLSATGSLGHIILSWEASSEQGLTGYNVYKSSDKVTFAKTADSPVSANTYDDAITSAGDGVCYYYKVTAIASTESGFSNVVKGIHGTRLPASSSAGFTTEAVYSPYVAEGSVVVNGGNLTVDTGTQLFITDNCTVDVEQGVYYDYASGIFLIKGLLRVVASSESPATFTSHRAGGSLADNEGFALQFNGAVTYESSDNSGTLVQNTQINNIRYSDNGIAITNCSPKLYNLKVTANSKNGVAYLYLNAGAGTIIENCSFNRMGLAVLSDLRSTSLKVEHNIFRNGYYSAAFFNLDNPGVSAGQIELNDFGCTREGGADSLAYLFNMTGGYAIPLGNNYWSGGTGYPPTPPTTNYGTTTSAFSFSVPSSALYSAPANIGPNW